MPAWNTALPLELCATVQLPYWFHSLVPGPTVPVLLLPVAPPWHCMQHVGHVVFPNSSEHQVQNRIRFSGEPGQWITDLRFEETGAVTFTLNWRNSPESGSPLSTRDVVIELE